MTLLTAVGERARNFHRFVRDVLGEDAYEKYLAYHRSSACEDRPLTEKEFWWDRMDRQDTNPQGRCC